MRQTTNDTTITRLTSRHCSSGLVRPQPQHQSASVQRTAPWPIHANDASPLAWWRMLPAHHFRDAEHLLLRATLDKVAVLQGQTWVAAMHGDAAAGIALALSLMPISTITLEIDIAMTALLLSSLEGDAATALMLSHVLGRTTLDHPFATELATSWLTHNPHCSSNRRRSGTAESALWKALQALDTASTANAGGRS